MSFNFDFADSMMHSTTEAQVEDKIAATQSGNTANMGAFGQPANRTGNDGNGWMVNFLSSSVREISGYFNLEASYGKLIEWWTTDGVQCSMSVMSDGTLRVYLAQAAAGGAFTGSGGGSELGESAAGVFQFNTQNHIYVRQEFGQGTGRVVVKVNGLVVIDESSIDNCYQATADCTQVRIFTAGSSNVAVGWPSHLAFSNASSDLVNYQPRVTAQPPTSDGGDETGAQTGGSAGDAYTAVDELDPDLTDYIELDVGERNSFMFSPPTGTAKVLAIQSVLYIKKTDADVVEVRPYVKIGGTRYYGTTVGVPADYAYLVYTWNQNPSTTSAWILADFPVEVGFERVT